VNEAPAFRVGDVVALKAGSAKLCVRSVDGDQVTVDWFDGETARSKTFAAAQLVLVEAPAPGEAVAADAPAAPRTPAGKRTARLRKWLAIDDFTDRNFDTLIESALKQKPKTEI
jgi:uncharacterized protein YodC (DUF2158 family)